MSYEKGEEVQGAQQVPLCDLEVSLVSSVYLSLSSVKPQSLVHRLDQQQGKPSGTPAVLRLVFPAPLPSHRRNVYLRHFAELLKSN